MQRAITILLALALDLSLGDPPNRFHPVVLMGRWLSLGRRLAPQQHRFWFGAGWIIAGIALFAAPWLKLPARRPVPKPTNQKRAGPSSGRGKRAGGNYPPSPPACGAVNSYETHLYQNSPCHPPSSNPPILQSSNFAQNKPSNLPTFQPSNRSRFHPSLLLHIPLLKSVFAYRNLRRSVNEVALALAADDLAAARRLLSWHLVSRDTSELTAEEVAGAAIESLAENLTDSLVAPLLAYAAGGLPAAWGYRFVNTADAMWGYRTAEFETLGKFAARLDDALNWLPARLTGWLLVAAAAGGGEDGRQAARVMLRQHARTASPNAGWTMSAMAGALGVTLTKRGVYALEGGEAVTTAQTVRRAVRLADLCGTLATTGICLGLIVKA